MWLEITLLYIYRHDKKTASLCIQNDSSYASTAAGTSIPCSLSCSKCSSVWLTLCLMRNKVTNRSMTVSPIITPIIIQFTVPGASIEYVFAPTPTITKLECSLICERFTSSISVGIQEKFKNTQKKVFPRNLSYNSIDMCNNNNIDNSNNNCNSNMDDNNDLGWRWPAELNNRVHINMI